MIKKIFLRIGSIILISIKTQLFLYKLAIDPPTPPADSYFQERALVSSYLLFYVKKRPLRFDNHFSDSNYRWRKNDLQIF